MHGTRDAPASTKAGEGAPQPLVRGAETLPGAPNPRRMWDGNGYTICRFVPKTGRLLDSRHLPMTPKSFPEDDAPIRGGSRRPRLVALVLLGAAVALAVYLVATRREQPAAPPGERAWRVEVIAVAPGSIAPELTLYGRVKAREDADLAAPGAAQVTEVLVREGERVAQGDLLVVLDPRDFEPAVKRAESEVRDLEAQRALERVKHEADLRSLESARERVAIARAEVARQRELKSKGLGSDQALDQARETLARLEQEWIGKELEIQSHEARVAQIEARLARAHAALRSARLALERSVLRAPFDGVVSQVDAAPGEWVQPGRVLARVYSRRSLEVHALIPQPYRATVAQVLSSGGRLEASSPAGHLRLERLSGEAETVGVTGIFSVGPAWSLEPGAIVSLHLVLPPVPGSVAVPASALYGGDTIYRVRDGRLQRIAVEVAGHRRGPDGTTWVVVRSASLRRGDRVVVTHLPQAVDGLRVEIVTANNGENRGQGTAAR